MNAAARPRRAPAPHHRRLALQCAVLALSVVLLSGCGGRAGQLINKLRRKFHDLTSNSQAAPTSFRTGLLTLEVDPAQAHPISPWIYGLNDAWKHGDAAAQAPYTFDRAGGNRWTAYNWETNASNAGSDWNYQSDTYLASGKEPAAPVIAMIHSDQAARRASLYTVQMQGLVAADTAGPVPANGTPDLHRFRQVVFRKADRSKEPFTATPSDDGYVYMDEFAWAVDQAFAGQEIHGAHPAVAPVFIELDNEPELWPRTHLEIQGNAPIPAQAYIDRTVALSRALKDRFPDLRIFGPAHFGFPGIYNWQDQLHATPEGQDWFTDLYLGALHEASLKYGRQLVDAYDLHWYPEARAPGGQRIIDLNSASLTDGQVQAIVQSPRSLWDPAYEEDSWISRDTLHGPIQLLPRLSSRIARIDPGMGLAITEYNAGGSHNLAGTLAQADNLGIFGAQGVFAANYWMLGGEEPYPLAGFRAYRDFDGAGSNFGDTALPARSSDPERLAGYVSRDAANPAHVVMVLVNRSPTQQTVTVQGLPLHGQAALYRIDGSSARGQNPIHPVAVGKLAVDGAPTLDLPALSVTTVDVR